MPLRLADLQVNEDSGKLNSFYVSFSDLMLLLCTFFVLMLGMSKIEIGSFEKLRAGFTGKKTGTLVELAEQLEKVAAGQKGVSVRLAEDGVRLDLESAALFDTGSAALKEPALDPLAPVLQMILNTKYRIDIEGHTDDRPFRRVKDGEIDSNWSLSGRRASSVAHYLLDFGFRQRRIRIVGYAATRPRTKIKTEMTETIKDEARAANRRVSLLVR